VNYGYIYKTTNIKTGKVYIGQSRGSFNPLYRGSGLLLKRDFKIYGRRGFVVEKIADAKGRKMLDILERYHIQSIRESLPASMIYNLLNGGGGCKGHTEQTLQHFRESRRGEDNPMFGVHLRGSSNGMYGKKHSPETREKIGNRLSMIRGSDHGNFGKVRSEETRIKVSRSKKTQNLRGDRSPQFGKNLSEETRKKISAAAKLRIGEKNQFFGRHHSEESKRKMSESRKRRALQSV
jgi:hypothetical protein